MKEKKGFGKIIGWVAIALVVLIVVSNSFAIIPTGYTGVRVTFGQISNAVVPNGINFKIPFVQEIQKVNNKQQDITFVDTISAETAERNEVFFSGVTVTYQINPSKSSWIYANVSDYKNNLVSENLVASALKGSSKSLTPTDVTNRNILEPLVKDNIQKSLDEKYGAEVVKINKVVVTNATFDDEYNNKIAQKQQAQMAYETQQIENKTAVEKAEADAKVKLRNAQADADALKVQAEAEAEANKLLEESLTPNVLKNRTIEKWNGQLPKVQGADGTIIDIGDVTNDNYSYTAPADTE
ncbi:MAG: hypothetical protein IKY04_04605 [Lachnospiraceae bacterium]|nr:hypothetical protein [Lachnospiraceae bacterium]MBR4993509.1 hypothetical protein [Lachnospiraceae bacterium]